MSTRREHDLLGDRDVPAGAYYGVHTLRAVESLPGVFIFFTPDEAEVSYARRGIADE